MARGKNTDYEVGYGKPPKKNQFQKGKSPNPGGRPKGVGSMAAAIRALGNDVVPQRFEGKEFTWNEALARRLFKMAMDGDRLAIELINKIAPEIVEPEEDDDEPVVVTLVLEEEEDD